MDDFVLELDASDYGGLSAYADVRLIRSRVKTYMGDQRERECTECDGAKR